VVETGDDELILTTFRFASKTCNPLPTYVHIHIIVDLSSFFSFMHFFDKILKILAYHNVDRMNLDYLGL